MAKAGPTMSTSGLDVFDKTLQLTNAWLKDIGEEIGADRRHSYQALRAVLVALRDRLTVEEAVQLAAQLPMLIRGIYFEGYRAAGKPERFRSGEEFLHRIDEHLDGASPPDSLDAARAVFLVLERRVGGGELEDVKRSLPGEIRALFPANSTTPLPGP